MNNFNRLQLSMSNNMINKMKEIINDNTANNNNNNNQNSNFNNNINQMANLSNLGENNFVENKEFFNNNFINFQ